MTNPTEQPPRGWNASYTVKEMRDWPDAWMRERLIRLTMEVGHTREEAIEVLRRVGERIAP